MAGEPNHGRCPPVTEADRVESARAGPCAAREAERSLQAPSDSARAAPPLGFVELDRYCEECGRNLYAQPVNREEGTALLVARCPECGRHHAAAQTSTIAVVWLKRSTSIAVLFWMIAVIAALMISWIPLAAMQSEMIDTFTTESRRDNIHTRAYREPDDIVWEVAALLTTLTALIGFFQVFVLMVTAHHWRRWAYFIAAFALPAAPCVFFMLGFWYSERDHFAMVLPFLLGMYGVAVAGALLAAAFGRVFGRLLIRALIPPRSRQVLAFLWVADGKPVPQARSRQAGG